MEPRISDDPAFHDLTARARIREAAIRLFAVHGVEETAILDIAKGAGVSGGLIRHHFGSKDGLRVACDTYVLSELTRFKTEAIEKGKADPEFLVTFDARQVLLRRYFGRAMIDGSPAAASRFDDIVDDFEQWFVDQPSLEVADARTCAAVMTAMDIGVQAMQDHIARALGEDARGPRLQDRIALAYSDIYAPALPLSPRRREGLQP
jgi:AcrR family transcriptional regulator